MGDSNPSPSIAGRRRTRVWVLPVGVAALLVFVATGYIQNTRPGWNVNSQFALTCAIVERHTLRIDYYHNHPSLITEDKVLFEGHYYCDKSPVTALLAVPSFFIYRALAASPGSELDYDAARYWTTWGTIGVAATLLTVLIAILLMRHGLQPEPASAVAALWIAATPILGYSILLFNYTPACAAALGGYLLVEPLMAGSSSDGSPSPTRRAARLFFGGLLLGLASWTLQTFALAAVIFTLGLVWAVKPTGEPDPAASSGRGARAWSRAALKLWPWALGGAIGASGYALYSLAIFGRVTSLYRYEFDPGFRLQMEQGLMGAGWPSLRVLFLITFHPFRGLFVLFPATLLAAVGLAWLCLRPPRLRHGAILAFVIGLALYNSAYYMWWGGWAYAPRHLIPILPFLCLGLAPWMGARGLGPRLWRSSPLGKIVVFSLLIAGALANLAVVALDPQLPPGLGEPLAEEQLLDPASVEQWPAPFFEALEVVLGGQTDPNWGTRAGLRGPWSLAPLAILWAIGLAGLLILGLRDRNPERSESS